MSYTVIPYTYNPDDLRVDRIAAQNDIPLAQLFKTIVVCGSPGDIVVAMVPGDRVLDLKALAQVVNMKKASLLPLTALLATVGYPRGACTPLAMKKTFPVVIDETAIQWPTILFNAGQRGVLFRMDPQDLQKVTQAKFASIT